MEFLKFSTIGTTHCWVEFHPDYIRSFAGEDRDQAKKFRILLFFVISFMAVPMAWLLGSLILYLNVFLGIVLGIFLIFFGRYSYYFYQNYIRSKVDDPAHAIYDRSFVIEDKGYVQRDFVNCGDPIQNIGVILMKDNSDLEKLRETLQSSGVVPEALRPLRGDDELGSLSSYQYCFPVIYSSSNRIYPLIPLEEYEEFYQFNIIKTTLDREPNFAWTILERAQEEYKFEENTHNYDLHTEFGPVIFSKFKPIANRLELEFKTENGNIFK